MTKSPAPNKGSELRQAVDNTERELAQRIGISVEQLRAALNSDDPLNAFTELSRMRKPH